VITTHDQPPALVTGPAIDVPDEPGQMALGAALARALDGRRGVIYLRGDLGAGKTTLVRGLLRALGHRGPVRSPTYTLIEPYEDLDPPVHHLDLYRLGDPEELDYLGLRDLVGGESLLLIEWPERGAGELPPPDLEVRIGQAPPGRRVELAATAGWAPVAAAVRAAVGA
jgi:tRNA threonylcarbamoyladenosine biosynthesis protein TsaE